MAALLPCPALREVEARERSLKTHHLTWLALDPTYWADCAANCKRAARQMQNQAAYDIIMHIAKLDEQMAFLATMALRQRQLRESEYFQQRLTKFLDRLDHRN